MVPPVIAADGGQEGLDLVAVQAMGHGCTVTLSDLRVLQDVVRDGTNDLVFQPYDATGLALKIRSLLTDDDMREQLSFRGREAVLERFDWHEVGRQYQQRIARCLTASY